jgi:LAO/AO transport system kinase
MATRGHLGGLARATADAALVLDASGCDIVLIETVGVGQDEVDIVRTADVSIVTLVPGAGDEVQALKAGIMEIADIFVVNKADRDGARPAGGRPSNRPRRSRRFPPGEWHPPILKTIATTGEGIVSCWTAVARFRDLTKQDEGRIGGQQRAENQVRDLIHRRFLSRLEHQVLAPGELQAVAAARRRTRT